MGNHQNFMTIFDRQKRFPTCAWSLIWIALFVAVESTAAQLAATESSTSTPKASTPSAQLQAPSPKPTLAASQTSKPNATSVPGALTHGSVDYLSYLESVAGPLGADDLEYGLDYLNERDSNVLQEFDFDPLRTAQILVGSAAKQNTTPGTFLADIQDLIFLQNRSRIETRGESSVADVTTRMVPEPGLFMEAENWRRYVPLRDSWRSELRRLERKYRIDGNSTEPDAATPTRILLMFPNFLNLGQKPFSVLSELCSSSDVCLPSFFSYPEFAGLIPLSGNDSARQAVFTLHLRALHLGREDRADALPFRTKCALVKRRMEKSLISDDRRWRFLQNNDVISANGDLTAAMAETYNQIPKEFKERVELPRSSATKQRFQKLYASGSSASSPNAIRPGPGKNHLIQP
ncbi:unnamed protein product [Bemisia tabaci]|uniref:Uncharacterized protein n=1 Tax=Bemisia tabaci TaxID=7038 RepID=A0A9P0A3N5_BEMTA|nr:unnamed protein product [Bemisia tabaci]